MRSTSVRIAALIAAILTAMLSPVASASSAAVPTKLKVKSSVSFRDRPSASSNVMRYLKPGEIVTALDMVNPSWYRIRDANGVTGYVSSSAAFVTVYSNARTFASTALRTKPSAASAMIRMLPPGAELEVKEKIDANWYRVQDANGNPGCVTTDGAVINADFSVTGVIVPMPERIEAIIDAGKQYLGIPYQNGSTRWDAATFDSSELTQTSFWEGARKVLPGDSDAQGDMVKSKGNDVRDWHELHRGDLMFFMSPHSNYSTIDKTMERVSHVGIYLGNGQILHTYSTASGGVRIDTIAGSQWERRFLFGGSAY